MGRLKIGIIIPTLDGGGAERTMVQLANGLSSRGHEVHLVVALNTNGPFKEEISGDVLLFDLEAGSRRRYAPRKLHKYIKANKPDIVVTALMNDWILLMKAVMRYDVKIVISEHSTFSKSFFNGTKGFMAEMMFFFLKKLYQLADKIVAVSNGVADDLLNMGLAEKGRIKTIYNAVIGEQFFAMLTEEPELPLLHPGIPNFISVGRLTEAKDYPVLLNAFSSVRKKLPCRLIILGDGELRESIERQRDSLDLRNDVLMPGFVRNPFPYMARADCFVLSSKFEGLSNALIEALACGVTSVSTDCPSGPSEILDGGKYGTLVPAGDAEALAEAMIRSLKDPFPKDLLKERAMFFSEENCVRSYLDLFGELMNNDDI